MAMTGMAGICRLERWNEKEQQIQQKRGQKFVLVLQYTPV